MRWREERARTNIPDDEPVFVIRAQDRLAIPAVRAWVLMAEILGVGEAKIGAALDELVLFHRWQDKKGSKVPD